MRIDGIARGCVVSRTSVLADRQFTRVIKSSSLQLHGLSNEGTSPLASTALAKWYSLSLTAPVWSTSSWNGWKQRFSGDCMCSNVAVSHIPGTFPVHSQPHFRRALPGPATDLLIRSLHPHGVHRGSRGGRQLSPSCAFPPVDVHSAISIILRNIRTVLRTTYLTSERRSAGIRKSHEWEDRGRGGVESVGVHVGSRWWLERVWGK